MAESVNVHLLAVGQNSHEVGFHNLESAFELGLPKLCAVAFAECDYMAIKADEECVRSVHECSAG